MRTTSKRRRAGRPGYWMALGLLVGIMAKAQAQEADVILEIQLQNGVAY